MNLSDQSFSAAMAIPAVREKFEQTMLLMLSEYQFVLQAGTPEQKQQLMRTALPDLLRKQRTDEESSKGVLQREAFNRMREGFAEHIKKNVPEWPT